jgi:hypothetical protein
MVKGGKTRYAVCRRGREEMEARNSQRLSDEWREGGTAVKPAHLREGSFREDDQQAGLYVGVVLAFWSLEAVEVVGVTECAGTAEVSAAQHRGSVMTAGSRGSSCCARGSV